MNFHNLLQFHKIPALQRWHAMGAITWVLGGAAAPISR